MNKNIYLVIGIVIFILLIGSYFKITNINSNNNDKSLENIIASEDKEEYGDSMAQLDISVYVLEHIKNKTTLSLINIF